jgi:hypothetical protein
MINHADRVANVELLDRCLAEQAALVDIGELHAESVAPLWFRASTNIGEEGAQRELFSDYYGGRTTREPGAYSFDGTVPVLSRMMHGKAT